MWASVAGSMFILSLWAMAYGSLSATSFPTHIAGLAHFLMAVAVPAGVAAVLVARLAPFGTVLTSAVATSFAGFSVVEVAIRQLFNYSPFQAVVGSFRSNFDAELALARKRELVTPDVLNRMDQFSDVVAASYMPLMLLIIACLMFTLSLVMIPRLPAGRVTGATYLFRNLSFPDWLLFGFIAGGLAPLAAGLPRLVGLNLLGVVVFLYLLQGLAIFRSVLGRFGFGPLGTLLAYVTLAFLMLYAVAFFALFLAGLFDPFFDFRKLKRKDDSNESDSD